MAARAASAVRHLPLELFARENDEVENVAGDAEQTDARLGDVAQEQEERRLRVGRRATRCRGLQLLGLELGGLELGGLKLGGLELGLQLGGLDLGGLELGGVKLSGLELGGLELGLELGGLDLGGLELGLELGVAHRRGHVVDVLATRRPVHHRCPL